MKQNRKQLQTWFFTSIGKFSNRKQISISVFHGQWIQQSIRTLEQEKNKWREEQRKRTNNKYLSVFYIFTKGIVIRCDSIDSKFKKISDALHPYMCRLFDLLVSIHGMKFCCSHVKLHYVWCIELCIYKFKYYDIAKLNELSACV